MLSLTFQPFLEANHALDVGKTRNNALFFKLFEHAQFKYEKNILEI